MKVVLGVALVVVGAAAIHFWREADAGRQQIAELTSQLDEQTAELTALRAMRDRPAAVAVVPVPEPAATAAATPAPPPAASPSPTIPLPDMDAIRARMSSPEGLAQRRELGRLTMARVNPDLDEALGLTKEEADELIDMLAAHQDRQSELFSGSRENTQMTTQERSALLREGQLADEAELQNLLGSKYSRWQDYKETRTVWQHRRDLRAVLDAGGIPMTEAQGKSFIAALSVEQRSINQEIRASASPNRSIAETSRYTPERRQRLINSAAAYLSPQQLEGYRGMLDRAAAQEQSMLAPFQSLQSQATAPPAPPAP